MSTVVLRSTDRGYQGPRFASLGPGYFNEVGPASSALGCSLTPGKHTSTSGTQPPGFLCQEAQVSHAKNMTTRTDVNTGDAEDVFNTRMERMTSQWSNTTHEEEHDANDADNDDDEDTTHEILIVDENKGKTENETQREQERAERNHRM